SLNSNKYVVIVERPAWGNTKSGAYVRMHLFTSRGDHESTSEFLCGYQSLFGSLADHMTVRRQHDGDGDILVGHYSMNKEQVSIHFGIKESHYDDERKYYRFAEIVRLRRESANGPLPLDDEYNKDLKSPSY
ncbi:MAG: hypothetical protein AAF492_02620, partial [Verrucomicrobiota bacterium]